MEKSVYDYSFVELQVLLQELGQPRFRSEQLWDWLYVQLASDYQSMSNLPKGLREQLTLHLPISPLEVAETQQSTDGETEKVLFRLSDNQYIETVLMRYRKRRTLCVSTQVGCAMGCVFCATGQMGFLRHLTVGEIVRQVVYFALKLQLRGERITNIVMMGMGEPLHNYDNTFAAIDTLTHAKGMNLGSRKITVSTVGLVPAIRRFADEDRQIRLAISLHAVTDDERSRLIPAAKRWPVAELMEVARYYVTKTRRRITFEWALISGKNDTAEVARQLGQLLQGMLCHVNLIPLNTTEGFSGSPSSKERVDAFQKELERYGVSSTVRVRRGIDIQAGCGQLRDRVVRAESTASKKAGIT